MISIRHIKILIVGLTAVLSLTAFSRSDFKKEITGRNIELDLR